MDHPHSGAECTLALLPSTILAYCWLILAGGTKNCTMCTIVARTMRSRERIDTLLIRLTWPWRTESWRSYLGISSRVGCTVAGSAFGRDGDIRFMPTF